VRPIVILDFGSQFCHLIGNRIRRLSAYSEIVPIDTPVSNIQKMNPTGIVLSGGPQSVFADDSPKPDPKLFDIPVPFLGICYGHQLIAHHFGGKIKSCQKEFGKAEFILQHLQSKSDECASLFRGVSDRSVVWMNHGDSVVSLPEGFVKTGETKDCPIAAYSYPQKNIHSVQFHPEVTHSEQGMKMLENFVDICKAKGTWDLSQILSDIMEGLNKKAEGKNVFLLVSGGVDSSVAFAILNKALGKDRVFGLFVDHGLLRKNEADEVEQMMNDAGFQNLHIAKKGEYFLESLAGLTEPEAKRNAIGNAFLEVQKDVAADLKLDSGDWLLGQGTIYPDHIETGGSKHASKIKTHHNRVPEIERMIKEGLIIEPIADFYKDEVREIGTKLGLPEKMVMRHPFPGPGLGVRILCQHHSFPLENSAKIESEIQKKFHLTTKVIPARSVGVQGDARSYRHPVAVFSHKSPHELSAAATEIPNLYSDINRFLYCLSGYSCPEEFFPLLPAEVTKNRVSLLQEADALIRQILEEDGLQKSVWQFPVVLLPFGISPNTESIILRPIQSENAMTATAVVFSDHILQKMNDIILQNLPHISAVFLDMTSKPVLFQNQWVISYV
jgi:GMP synthase (glutamine-hydrolysing)